MMKMDGFDAAIVGTTWAWRNGGKVEVLVYSGNRILDILCERDGMDRDGAMGFMDINIEGAYVGVGTPVVMWEVTPKMIEAMYEEDDDR